jgi:hypothetical protein
MAGWMARVAGFRTVLVVRHPCATIESQLRSGWDPAIPLKIYRADEKLHEVTDGRYLELLNSNLTTVEEMALKWVIENQWPVAQSDIDGYSVFYYEDLVSRHTTTWANLCSSLELQRIPDEALRRRPSQQAFFESSHRISEQAQRKPRWNSSLSKKQLDEIQRILDVTECTLYSVFENDPIVRARAGEMV